ncbi:CRAL/TRIO domain-containing protein [Phanerochaete sordida]|uniref:CRAL/TRIO domain-containing protein n=1 Tax=Phanerochaete sordida TaxID=48140 RepID=A0A9P3GEI6_9APHY|nr:CRAL/TRIO domain-containing protein [Phanerochaete sordida]
MTWHTKALASPYTERLPQEPQNALTSRFTQAERDALQRLRPMLPDIRRMAYNGETPKTISLWGVSIDPLDPTADPRASVVLMKFLRARKLDAIAAKTLLVEVLRWRKKVNIDELMNKEFPKATILVPRQRFGKDKAGRSVMYTLFTSEHVKLARTELEADSKMFIERKARSLEELARSLNYETIDRVTRVIDMSKMSLDVLLDPKWTHNSMLTRVTHDYYPDFSAYKFAINAPLRAVAATWFSSLFATVKPDGRLHFIGKDTKTIGKKLSSVIDLDELPEQFGGKAIGFSWEVEDMTAPRDDVVAEAQE